MIPAFPSWAGVFTPTTGGSSGAMAWPSSAAWRACGATCAAGQIEPATLDASISGWIAHVAHGDTWGLRRLLISAVLVPGRRSNDHHL